MVIAILVIVSVIELALMTNSLLAKSRRETTRGVVRIVTLAAFAILVGASVIQWSLRWVGLAALLLILAARGVWALLDSRRREGEYSARAIVFRALAILLLAFAAVTPALVFPPYQPLAATGPYPVATARVTYVDESRIEPFAAGGENRHVNASFWYPQNVENGETFPLVVFSHGGLGLETSNESLYHELASHGYVVCSIGHPYHALWTRDQDGRVTFVSMDYMQEIQREDAKRDKQQSYLYYQKWLETRTGDFHLVIDTILQHAADGAGGLYDLVDVEKIGVMGHSLGGSAALAVPRQRDDIAAVIALESPFLVDIVGVDNDEFVWTDRVYPTPVLNVYSDGAWEHLASWAQYAANYALLLDAPATAISLHLPGAGHFSLTDLSLVSPFLVRILEGGESTRESAEYLQDVSRACLEFFDHYLKNRSGSAVGGGWPEPGAGFRT